VREKAEGEGKRVRSEKGGRGETLTAKKGPSKAEGDPSGGKGRKTWREAYLIHTARKDSRRATTALREGGSRESLRKRVLVL